MKKLFTLLLAGLCLGACNDGDDPIVEPVIEPVGYAGFRGELTVTPNPGSPFQPFTEQEVEFRVFRESDTQLSILIPKIKFVKEMPVYVAFELRDLHDADPSDPAQFRFAVEECLPYWNGAPYDPDLDQDGQPDGTYRITNLRGSCTPATGRLEVEFDCYSMHVSYSGLHDPATAPFRR